MWVYFTYVINIKYKDLQYNTKRIFKLGFHLLFLGFIDWFFYEILHACWYDIYIKLV